MPNTEAGLPLTSMLRRSSRSTVGAASLAPALACGAVCARASTGGTVAVANVDKRKARRDSMIGLLGQCYVTKPGVVSGTSLCG
jgi:hypothetical protein